jgi:hypothetical protein
MANRLRVFSVCGSVSILWWTLCTTCAAQGTGTIVGKVTDENGVALAEAKVNALRLDSQQQGSGIQKNALPAPISGRRKNLQIS